MTPKDPLPIQNPNIFVKKFFFRVRSAITIGAGSIGAPLELADYK
jgi:hypothetical protein